MQHENIEPSEADRAALLRVAEGEGEPFAFGFGDSARKATRRGRHGIDGTRPPGATVLAAGDTVGAAPACALPEA